ncbi:nucleolar protein 12 [Trichomonascus vanleenenianus]|uniref:rRNA-processing protein NOP12 n=1 Tax=Trichomonascus vanleenenianus TaxID=2268995 RepID=UPI003ECA8CAC
MGLFGSIKQVDEGVDSLFKSSAKPVEKAKPAVTVKPAAPVVEEEDDAEISELSDAEFDDEEEDVEELLKSVDEKKTKKNKRKQEDTELEDRYMQSLVEKPKKRKDKKKKEEEEESDKESEDSSEEIVEDKKEESIVPVQDEVDKAERTVFVGNLSVKAITDKSAYKALKSAFEELGKVESIRFRSIAFSEMLPRKAAFVKQKFHASRDTVNAYVVYKEKADAKSALKLNGTEMLEHHIRVDSVAHPAKHEPKRSVFIGNLDFEATEEPLWKHFSSCGDIEYVRIVRDSKTNVGKGFAYVQFLDSVAVSKALLLNNKPYEGTKRKLRVNRCKNVSTRPSSKPKTQAPGVKLSHEERTKLGRARSVVGKAGRAKISTALEGMRAKPGDVVPGLKIGKNRKKPRIRDRTTKYRKSVRSKPN